MDARRVVWMGALLLAGLATTWLHAGPTPLAELFDAPSDPDTAPPAHVRLTMPRLPPEPPPPLVPLPPALLPAAAVLACLAVFRRKHG